MRNSSFFQIKRSICDVIEDWALYDSFHPVREYLDELHWDAQSASTHG